MLVALAGLALLVPATLSAQALDTGGIMTGSPGGTDIRVGQDIARLARRFGVALEVVPSQGALENVEAMRRRPDVQLGIVQSDVLDFVASSPEDPDLRRMREELRIVFPLYPEEVHVLAQPGIATFADLQGRRVAVGEPGSGTLLTATLLLATAGVKPAEELRLGGGEALAALRGGRADAMVDVAGQPVALFRDAVAVEDALHLVPVDLPALRSLYPAVAIPADTYYPWQPKGVPTVAPRAVLVTRDWTKLDGQEGACRLVGKVARVIADNLDHLRRDGHPKWSEVSLDARVPGWERSSCVEQALSGPDHYVLGAPAEPRPPRTSSAPPGDGTATRGRPPRRSHAQARDCSAEDDPVRRRLCEVRPQLGAGP
jgi:TRAP transporter TAXI family solute receptor